MAEIKLAEAKELCTKTELNLYLASKGKELTAQDPATLRKNRERARQFRDKWRDLAIGQRRELQKSKGTREVMKTERSARKAQLFQEALDRLQQKIDLLPADELKAATAPAKKSTSKAKRTVAHRAQRAEVRQQLGEVRDAKLVNARKTATPPVSAPPSDATPEAADSAPQQTQPAANASVSPSPGPKKTAQKQLRLTKTKTPAVQQLNSPQQQQAQTAAKEQRKQISGKTTRVRGHVSARGKRNQASRDQKNRG